MLFQYLIEVVGSQPFTQTDVEPYFVTRPLRYLPKKIPSSTYLSV